MTRGGNYGWNIREGTHCFDPKNPRQPPATCLDKDARGEPLDSPAIEYDHSNRTVVVGGYLYNGRAMPELQGTYIFGDWSSGFSRGDGTLLLARPSEQGLWSIEEIRVAGSPGRKVNASSDSAGPSGDTGKIYRMVPAAASPH